MRKYVFSILFFIGCFFMHVSLIDNEVSAMEVTSIVADEHDERVLTISLANIYGRVETIRLYEVEICQQGEIGCSEVPVPADNKEVYVRKLIGIEPAVYSIAANTESTTIGYTISSHSDGVKHFYLETSLNVNGVEQIRPDYSYQFDYTLSTLNQRIVINPDGKGSPLHVYNHIQYSPSRVLNIKIDLLEDEIENVYSGEIYVFEENNNRYSYWLVSDGAFDFGLQSYGDGLKTINIFLVKKGVTIDESGNVYGQLTAQNEQNARKIDKTIHLDTIGPDIDLTGGDWIVLNKNEKYTVQEATCKDANFQNDPCEVTNDANIVKIDYSSNKYQVVTYEASDKLGNTNTISVRIKVIQGKDNSEIWIYLTISGVVLLLTAAILAYVLIKNNEKKKKMSYI